MLNSTSESRASESVTQTKYVPDSTASMTTKRSGSFGLLSFGLVLQHE